MHPKEPEGVTPVDPFEQLVEALNRMADETGDIALSITFNRSDTPVDWDLETGRWTVLEPEGEEE